MENCIRRLADSFDSDLARSRVKQSQLLGRPRPNVLVGVAIRLALMPVVARIGERRVRASLVLGPNRQGVLGVGCFDQPLFARASGSCTVTVPLLRLRTAVPVSHQLRSFPQVKPASCSTDQIV